VVMTNGVFDILHAGHVSYLANARKLGDRLIVAVNSDASTRRLKGETRPVNPQENRMIVLSALEAVDWVVLFEEDTPQRLIADVLPDTLAFGWSRTEPDPALLAAVQSSDYQPVVVFPASYADPGREVLTVPPVSGKPPLFIMLDGTWSEARKMFRKSPWLDHFPVMSLSVNTPSRYTLREAHGEGQHCTAEVAAALLAQAGDSVAASALQQHFERFRHAYLAGKPHHPVHTQQALNSSEN